MEDAKEYADEIGAVGAFEVSAKDDIGLNELFDDIAQKLYKKNSAHSKLSEINNMNKDSDGKETFTISGM